MCILLVVAAAARWRSRSRLEGGGGFEHGCLFWVKRLVTRVKRGLNLGVVGRRGFDPLRSRALNKSVNGLRRNANAAANAKRFKASVFYGLVDGEWVKSQLNCNFIDGVKGAH